MFKLWNYGDCWNYGDFIPHLTSAARIGKMENGYSNPNHINEYLKSSVPHDAPAIAIFRPLSESLYYLQAFQILRQFTTRLSYVNKLIDNKRMILYPHTFWSSPISSTKRVAKAIRVWEFGWTWVRRKSCFTLLMSSTIQWGDRKATYQSAPPMECFGRFIN